MKRRFFLKAAGLSTIAGLSYSLWRGLRYPRLSLETKPHETLIQTKNSQLELLDCFQLKKSFADVTLRAYAPEPSITINSSSKPYTLAVNNIATNAKLHSTIPLKESIEGITRHILIPSTNVPIKLEWKLPEMDSFKFAAIGDTGGNKELEWCIERAEQLGSQFFIHLGDLNYSKDDDASYADYAGAINLLHNANIPCYVSCGNHDYKDSGLVVDKFLDYIGPLNNSFVLNNVRFSNIDTAVSFLPISGGLRDDMLEELVNDTTDYTDNVLFTHRPLHDPRPNEDHDLGNTSERDWLIGKFKRLNVDTILFGHIHSFYDFDYQDFRFIIAGGGMALHDLAAGKSVSKIVVGTVNKNEKVKYSIEDLAMPREYHCHHRAEKFTNGFADAEHFLHNCKS